MRNEQGDVEPSTLNSIHSLAALYQSQGKYDLADSLYKNCLAMGKSEQGDIELSTVESMHSLAALNNNQGKYGIAEPLYTDCLAMGK